MNREPEDQFFYCVCCGQPFTMNLMSPELDDWCIHCDEGHEQDYDDEDY